MHEEYLIYLVERDVYARQAIMGFLSWDRRTRVIGSAGAVGALLERAQSDPTMDRLDVVMLDTRLANDPQHLGQLIETVQQTLPQAEIICMGHGDPREQIRLAYQLNVRAYLTREYVGAGIANAVRFAMRHEFVATRDIAQVIPAEVLPRRKRYPRLTRRIEQALQLCVVEGLPAELAADEMGVSISTVRSYIKEGYRILEAQDDTIYPEMMSPAERAFLRYTALEQPLSVWGPAA